ncbi:MAG: 1-acyl-sn-glycerol-3-phosphate acyltransferase [Bacteroidales bacterium]|nr:1-acyl-sn-glycerol-3-phosphate acyltransferase [Bacteroidales bacterium]
MPALELSELEALSPVFRGKAGNAFANALMEFTGVAKVNRQYDAICQYEGVEFANALLRDLGIDYAVGNPERLEQLPEGPFITVSNHPNGHVDGVALVDLFGHRRGDYKVMVNKILAHFKTLQPSFITVTPTGSERTAPTAESISGVRLALAHIREGHPLGLFPSGAVSDYIVRERRIRDREWQEPIVKFIRKAGVPVVPVRFFDRNSRFYYGLGLIDWRVRLMRLCWEMFNKKGKPMRIGIGPTLSPEELKACDSVEKLGERLRSSVYDMPLPEHWAHRTELHPTVGVM